MSGVLREVYEVNFESETTLGLGRPLSGADAVPLCEVLGFVRVAYETL